MFIRIKTTPNSPRKSVQIVESVRKKDKVSQKIVRHVGIAMDNSELEKLKELAEFIKCKIEEERQPKLFKPEEIAKRVIKAKKEKRDKEKLMVNIKQLREEQRSIVGIHEIYGKMYDEIGFDKVLKNPARNKSSCEILKDITLARIANPLSKMGSVEMLERDFGIGINLNNVYRMMDKIDENVEKKIQNMAYQHTRNILSDKVNVVFVDATTLYFESFDSDKLRQNGYSKDLKFKETQILFAILVTEEGLPVGYQIFSGSTYEGHTLIPILQDIKKRYELNKVIFVSDSGLMNDDNLKALEKNGFEYIVGARIKNVGKELKKDILNLNNYQKAGNDLKISRLEYKKRKLIVSYSEKRAQKNAWERQKNIDRLIKKVENNGKVKDLMGNYGYKKYISVETNEKLKLDEEKIKADQKWDGLHGVITNAKHLSNNEILEYYHGLWQVEESFRINKHDLKIRPIFHWKPERIKAHMAIAFMAFTCVRNLEYRVKLQYKKLSPAVIRRELLHVQGSLIVDDSTNKQFYLPSKMSNDAKKIYKLMNVSYKTHAFPL